MRLIDADELKDGLFDGTVKNGGDLLMAAFVLCIDATPTVDAVPVVRCRDCKWWKTGYFWNGTERKVCVIEPYEPCRNPNDYCSRGERKDGADDE